MSKKTKSEKSFSPYKTWIKFSSKSSYSLGNRLIISRYQLFLAVLFLVSFGIRFYNFSDRWGLGGDDARDAMIALEALSRRELPLIGSFSSAGPFVFGPLFYWTLMLSYVMLPFTLAAPWLFTVIFGSLTVIILSHIGTLIGGKRLAILVGIFAATSPQLVTRSMMSGQHTYIAATASLLILGFILLLQKKQIRYALLMGISLGVAFSMHYQAINLLLFFPILLLLPEFTLRKKIVSLLVMIFGFIIPSIPLLYWDMQQSFANIRNVLDYLLIAQYRIYVPNSWRLFIFQYFSDYWSFVIGGAHMIGLLLMIITVNVSIYSLLKRNIPKILILLGGIFFILTVVNRFYRGERSEGYLIYFVPFILIFSSWAIKKLITNDLINSKNTMFTKLSPFFGIVLISLTIIGNVYGIYKNAYSYKSSVKGYKQTVRYLKTKYPGKKFAVYDYKYKMYGPSTGFSMILDSYNLADDNGMPLGIGCYEKGCPTDLPIIVEVIGNPVFNLSKLNQPLDNNPDWANVSRSGVYDDLITRWTKNKLTSNFNINEYVQNKIGL